MSEPRRRTFTEEARRRQIVERTIELVAERGAAAASLSAIAARAGISKAAVLYHFASKDAVLDATMRHVLDAYVAAVGARIDAADGPEGMLVAYLRATIEHMRDHPAHVRVLVEGLTRTPELAGDPSRRQAVAGILEQGQRSGVFRPFDARVLALTINGALDAVIGEWITAPDLDLDRAATELETAVLAAVKEPTA
ncbi:MAG TPA: TetR/AcrR family transcriptional regulator [Pseudonocardia sp.]|jgi:AcrR family transcriptional regulator|uniref:TetR/AcrR family transcriptional regulator n=1 Tax=Pseudonocardia sp. TaxID=60912 RepID=UPI002B4B3D87|nr:TetR/AcrR family transcriptional regulator [Pseudonocardia sp.]HLU57026.1 TetR/AcrR family transcriptional regulator [Pseudonocardia sp.]